MPAQVGVAPPSPTKASTPPTRLSPQGSPASPRAASHAAVFGDGSQPGEMEMLNLNADADADADASVDVDWKEDFGIDVRSPAEKHGDEHVHHEDRHPIIQVMQEYNLPLVGGVVVAMLMANFAEDLYHDLWHSQWGNAYIFGHKLSAHFVISWAAQMYFFSGLCQCRVRCKTA